MELLKPGFEDLELSTRILIQEAESRGIRVDILDRKDNFLQLSKGGKSEFIKQATRTSMDNYIAPLIMENKLITKKILAESNINVPRGETFDDFDTALAAFDEFRGRAIVIKPKSTNFGIGITMIRNLQSEQEYQSAIEEGFEFDRSIIVEDLVEGKEYRFLVIDDRVVGVLHRVAANVVGDGEKSIRELVEKKNRDPLRGVGYKKPLEQIRLGNTESCYLLQQGKDFNTVPAEGEQVFLRRNSNISTGGDSIDYTDEMSDVYKAIAIKATKAVGAKISGVDMIIKGSITSPDMNHPEENYSLIELNYNPAIHIHGFPYQGRNRHAEKHILDLLGF